MAKRTPEEIRAQREAFLAAKAAKAAGKADGTPAPAPPAPMEKLAESTQPPAARPVEIDKPKPVPKPAPAQAAPSQATGAHITRREFLNYAWLASIALFSAETVGLSLWFAFPNFKSGQFGGQFTIGAAVEVLPEVNAAPKAYTEGKFWLVNLDTTNRHGEPRKGILALYKVCTHLGCLYDWATITNRFECPCHGSKFELTGDYISGPARRSLDRFIIQAVAPDGSIKETDAEGNPLVIEGDETLIIDTGKRILGAPVT
ncbi:MAG: ubiquinol-cytochrome c reductase iron-sulfur subunit [Chloroflexi bacterium]|nr:ubiquinol-cytochrome c reductase iron-sulfur subunit [Chloroflexota bacterium]